jgi:phosphoglycolate phosphatase
MDGVEALIQNLNLKKIPWGIVTNKASKFSVPIVTSHAVLKYAQCLISGDDVNMSKPSPEGLIKAASMISIQPSEVIYLGDDRRDVIAANDAGMISMIARYGYLEEGDDGENWNAHHIIDKPEDLLNYL